MGETEPQLNIFCHKMNLPVPGLGSVYLLVKGASHGNLQTTKAFADTIDCSPQWTARLRGELNTNTTRRAWRSRASAYAEPLPHVLESWYRMVPAPY